MEPIIAIVLKVVMLTSPSKAGDAVTQDGDTSYSSNHKQSIQHLSITRHSSLQHNLSSGANSPATHPTELSSFYLASSRPC